MNMNDIKKRIYRSLMRIMYIGWVGASLCSCEKYLDIKPYGQTIPKTTEEYAALVHELCYEIDYGHSESVGGYGDAQECEAFADNMATNLGAANDYMAAYVGSSVSFKQDVYKNLYEEIRNCNIILGEFEDGRDTREGQDIVGTAYALRGVCYYQLLRMFCEPPLADATKPGVPIVTEFDMEAKPIRSTMQETIDQAERDLKTALTCDIQEKMYRFNNDVLHGYLARLYHWCGRWQEARDEARLVLEKHPLLSGDDYVKMMQTQYGLVGNRIFMGDLLTGGQLGITGAMSFMERRPLSADFVKLFAEGTNDIRRKGNLFFNRKRTNKKLFFTGMRSAEMALISMECAYHLNMQDSALYELNMFRKNRITGMYVYNLATLPPVDDTALIRQDATGKPLTPLIQAILNERRKELYLENGDRWFELKRNGRPEWWVAREGMKFWTRQFMYTWPINVTDLELQPGLVQNPGYEETY
jgi:hypothetical protein